MLRILTVAIAGVFAGLAGGCAWMGPAGDAAGWHVATGLARGATASAAAAEAASLAARGIPAGRDVQAVIFFECFDEPAGVDRVGAAMHRFFPSAQVIGCSAAAVLTGQGASADRAVAVLSICAPAGAIASAWLPPAGGTGRSAGERLAQMLGPAPPGSVYVAFTERVTLADWDPDDLLAGLSGESGTPVLGGLAHVRSRGARLYHQQRVYDGGVVALRLGPARWSAEGAHDLLPIGPLHRLARVNGRVVNAFMADGQSAAPADAVARLLAAQDRPDAHVGRVVGNRYLPLSFKESGGGLLLPQTMSAGDGLTVLRAGLAAQRAAALRTALAGAISPGRQAGAFTLLFLPAGPGGRLVDELPAWQQESARARIEHPTVIGFLGDGQFLPLWTFPSAGRTYYADRTFVAAQVCGGR